MLTVITGCMFSSKSNTLIQRMNCAKIAKQSTLLLKPKVDTRSSRAIVSHDLQRIDNVIEVKHPSDVIIPRDLDVLGIDEVQFLGKEWIEVIERSADAGIEVYCALLNQDAWGTPFGIAPYLLAVADNIIHLKAVCSECGKKEAATKTHRISEEGDLVEIGGVDKYQALCRSCWVALNKD